MSKHTEQAAAANWLVGGGEMGAIIRAKDWSSTPLGPVDGWPQSLRSAVSILLPSRAQICLFWGPDLVAIYNDAYRPTLGVKHPRALGQPAREVWSEFWDEVLRPLLEGVLRTGEAFWASDHPFFLERHGYPEETYFDISYDPVRDESGKVGGVFCIVSDTTGRVIGERRLHVLRDLGRIAGRASSVDGVFAEAVDVLAGDPHDIAFLLVVGANGRIWRNGDEPVVASWPIEQAADAGELFVEGAALAPFGVLPGGPWPEAARALAVLPIVAPGQPPYGYLVTGASPRLPFDAAYRDFMRLVASNIAGAAAAAHALEQERSRAEALAKLDRAKTAFFSNVSHEFRTPLTLMLGPLEDLLGDESGDLPADVRSRIETAHRNSRRLLKLVNVLLDFSRIEAGRAKAWYAPTDLARTTAELASNFHSACEKAGLSLVVDCPPLPEPVWVDAAMWERIVLNLLSNAFKFTLEGSIEVSVRAVGGNAELRVRDTGVGISETDLPHLFERFHRVEQVAARTHEGSGIGLALVREVARLHGGEVHAESRLGKGSTFIVSLPFGNHHLPTDALQPQPHQRADTLAGAHVEEALGWLRDAPAAPAAPRTEPSAAHVLVVDDNADMREHLTRVLAAHWRITAVADGQAALEVVARQPVNLIVTDVMMPRMDGFALLSALKAAPETAAIPVVMLSARAGEESRIEGLAAGADDYVIKPFSAAQLIAQVRAQLTVQRTRRESALERERLLTQERVARRDAQLQHEHLVSLFSQAPNPMVILRGPQHIIDLVNEPTCQVWDRRAEEVLGKPLFEALPELRGQVFEGLLDGVLRTGTAYHGKETAAHFRRADGTVHTRYFNFVYAPLRGIDGDIEGVLVTAFDVTEEILARQQMAALRQQAEAASRAKDQFLAMLGHELRNPLAPVVTALRLLRLRGHRSSELDILERQTGNLTRLVDDLLDVSRITRGKIELRRSRLELAHAVDKALEMAHPLLEQGRHSVDVNDLPREGLQVDADPQRLAQIICNLLTNAAKYSEAGTPVKLSGSRDGTRVRLAVRDHGVGISPSMLERVFDLFVQQPQTLERSAGGLGLGLAIARNLAILHGGSLAAHSEGVGKGSEFVLELPAAAVEAPVAPQDPVVAQAASSRDARRILVVDDNVDAASSLAEFLRLLGHSVHVAHHAAAALDLAKSCEPEIALVDIGLPDMDGYELGRQLRRCDNSPPLVLVAVTGYGLPADRERSASAGFDRHLVKPIDLAALGTLLSEVGAAEASD